MLPAVAWRERVKRSGDAVRGGLAVCTERGRLVTESYRETEGEPPVIRQAKALAKLLREVSIAIDDHELIVGKATTKRRGAALVPEINAGWLLEEMDSISTRDWDRFAPLSEDEKTEMRQFLPYWEGRSVHDVWRGRLPTDKLEMQRKGVLGGVAYCNSGVYFGHCAVDYNQVLTKGLSGLRREVEDELETVELTDPAGFEKYQFLTAVAIVLDAASSFAARYATLATTLAEGEQDPTRKSELEMIAETCARVPGEPARTFFEAMQSVYFTWIVLMLEGWAMAVSLGRADQYLYPFYERDVAEGRLTRDEARAIISLLYIKLNTTACVLDDVAAGCLAGFPQTVNVTLGGLTRDGKDAVNELSYLFLEADEDVAMSQNDLIIRIHKSTPDAFVMRACELAKTLRGKLKFLSDETAIQQLLNDGYPIEHARDYIITGCNSPSVPGYSFDIPGGMFNLPMMLELALNDGVARLSGEQLGPKTGDPRTFASYEDVWKAYTKQVEALLPLVILTANVDRASYAELAPTPFLSCLIHGCIEKGLDVANGGTAPYARRGISLCGAPNVGDSLAAIKRAVFDDRRITIGQVVDALDRDFEGDDEVLHFLTSAPKFGNDDDYVDSIVGDVLKHGCNEVLKYRCSGEARYNVAAAAVTANIPLGAAVGALPDGRRAREPLSEGGLSPYQGRNTSGPTPTMRSVAKIDHVNLTNGSVLNMTFNPAALKDEASLRKFGSLVRTYCETGGFLVQFNIIDTRTLRAAQKDPDKYRDLLVRVATYSAYFVELSPELQEDVIRRMEFQET